MKDIKILQGPIVPNTEFLSTDSPELYEENLKKQPKNWIWRSKPVSYNLNKQHYRTSNWSDCNWNNSVLVFGCSFVFGVGVGEDDTLCYQLSKNLNLPAINLGQPGVGINFIWANSVLLKSQRVVPKACVYVWPDISRQTEFLSPYEIDNHGAWNIEDSAFGKMSLNETHNLVYYGYMIKNLKLLWNCPVIDATFYKNISKTYQCDFIEYLDQARDISTLPNGFRSVHPGPNSLKQGADIITKRLNNGI